MATRKRPRLRRTIEGALLARDRAEIAAAERLLRLLKSRGKKKRARAR